jgi:L-ascorbate metabolism protein UlaG (beta-lactamase superfamily)
MRLGGVRVSAVPARHGDGRRLGGRRAATIGYLIDAGVRLYFAGDSRCFPSGDGAPGSAPATWTR